LPSPTHMGRRLRPSSDIELGTARRVHRAIKKRKKGGKEREFLGEKKKSGEGLSKLVGSKELKDHAQIISECRGLQGK